MARAGRKTKVAAGPSGEGLAAAVSPWLLEAAKRLVPLAILAAAYLYGSDCLWKYAGTKSECIIARTSWKDGSAAIPAWLPPPDIIALNGIAASAKGRPIFEPGLCSAVAQAYASNPWVERVEEVRSEFGRPPALQADIRLRVPFAVISGARGGCAVVDRTGAIVPLQRDDAAKIGLPSVFAPSRIAGAPGERITAKPILDALSALGMVRDRLATLPPEKAIRITEARITDAGGRNRLVFSTAAGTRIEWGELSDEPAWGEPTARQKLDLLEARAREIRDWTRVEQLRLDHSTAPMKLADPPRPQPGEGSPPGGRPRAAR
jgi:hypothetical protein